jgi:plastocyanin
MKSITVIIFLAIILFGCNKSDNVVNSYNPPTTSGTHVISAGGTAFSPVSVSAKVGDTVKFIWSSGTHTTTSTSVPTGAATWNAPLTSTNTSFIYIITVAGTYNFQCNFHASMGMTGSFTTN